MKGEEETQGVNFFQKGSWFLLGFLSVFDIVSESIHRLPVFHDFFFLSCIIDAFWVEFMLLGGFDTSCWCICGFWWLIWVFFWVSIPLVAAFEGINTVCGYFFGLSSLCSCFLRLLCWFLVDFETFYCTFLVPGCISVVAVPIFQWAISFVSWLHNVIR